MILVKLGGSIITDKGKPLSARRRTTQKVAESLAGTGVPAAVVHGGGSFGHYWSVKYDMHTKEKRYEPRGVATVKNSMVHLHKMVLDAMFKAGLNPYSFPPAGFMSGGTAVPERMADLGRVSRAGMVPVTYGDALWHSGSKTYILSGDRIMTHLAGALRPRLCIFVLDEDGLYRDMRSRELIRVMNGDDHAVSDAGMDVTGGMARKVREATAISDAGTPVFFVNGNRPDRIAKAIKDRTYEGTLFGRKRHVRK